MLKKINLEQLISLTAMQVMQCSQIKQECGYAKLCFDAVRKIVKFFDVVDLNFFSSDLD